MTRKKKSPFHRQLGLSLQGTLLSLAIVAASSALVFTIFRGGSLTQMNQAAFSEVTMLLTTMYQVGVTRGFNYGSLTQADLIAETPLDNANNVFGTAFTIAVAAGNWQLTYTFPDNSSCQYVLQRINDHPGVTGTPACAAGVLTATVE